MAVVDSISLWHHLVVSISIKYACEANEKLLDKVELLLAIAPGVSVACHWPSSNPISLIDLNLFLLLDLILVLPVSNMVFPKGLF